MVLELTSNYYGAGLEFGKTVNKEVVIHYMNNYKKEVKPKIKERKTVYKLIGFLSQS